ncbi:hypothetical protein KBC31_00005 [Candidatus Saccharibacteria bacterium]|nr:hypothetical protein [Candidatus Saccharibacteria bacterium]
MNHYQAFLYNLKSREGVGTSRLIIPFNPASAPKRRAVFNTQLKPALPDHPPWTRARTSIEGISIPVSFRSKTKLSKVEGSYFAHSRAF